LTLKLPSPEVKPAIHWGLISMLFKSTLSGLSTGITLGKKAFSLAGKPRFKDALRAIIYSNPS